MEYAIADLVSRFERGALTRRQLITGLSLLATAAGAGPARAQAGLKATSIGHVSILVSDLQRSVDFYRKAFGLTVVSEDAPNKIARMGTKGSLVTLRQAAPVGVDHFALGIEGFRREAAEAQLKAQGFSPAQDTDSGFHVKDPDGVNVQMV